MGYYANGIYEAGVMNIAIVHNGSDMLKDLVPRGIELKERHSNNEPLWPFQWTKNRYCLLSLDDYSLCAWLRTGGSLERLQERFERIQLDASVLLLGTAYFAFAIMLDRNALLNKKIYRSNKGLILDLCHTLKSTLKYMYVDRKNLPIIESTVPYDYSPFGYRLGPNA